MDYKAADKATCANRNCIFQLSILSRACVDWKQSLLWLVGVSAKREQTKIGLSGREKAEGFCSLFTSTLHHFRSLTHSLTNHTCSIVHVKRQKLCDLKSKCQHTNSPCCSPHISYTMTQRNKLGEIVYKSTEDTSRPFGDHFFDSYHLYARLCSNIMRRNWMSIKRENNVYSTKALICWQSDG